MLDATTNIVHLLFTRNNTSILATSSSDHGKTWTPPVPVPEKPGCASCWIAPSFSAIQLRHHPRHAGDLVVCLDYSNRPGHAGGGPAEMSGTLISTDHGATWHIGATNVTGDECAIAELPNGTVVLNARNYVNPHRAVSWSHDGGRTFGATRSAMLPHA